MDVILDRDELYREVWVRSVGAVARKYGLTEGDIRKACYALDVPRPTHGYWTKVKTGTAPPCPPLLRKSGASTYTCKTISRTSKGATEISKRNSTKPAKEKESLVDWVLRGAPSKAERQAAAVKELEAKSLRAYVPTKPAATRQGKVASTTSPRYVPLRIWAQAMFGEYAPHKNTLIRWVHDGHISPMPRKIGRTWFVKVDADYVA